MLSFRRSLAAGAAASLLFPFVVLVLLSLARAWVFPGILPAQFSFDNWRDLFSARTGLAHSVALSLLISVTVASVVTLLGFLTSRAIAYHPKGGFLLMLAYFPYFFSPVIYAACLYFFFVKFDFAGTLTGVLLGQLIIAYPFSVIFFSGYWSGRLRAYEELVNTLGGSGAQALVRVLIPVSRNLLAICFFQTFLISWFEYGLTGLLGVGKIQTLTIMVYQYVNEGNTYDAAVAGCLLCLPPILLLWLNKSFVLKAVK